MRYRNISEGRIGEISLLIGTFQFENSEVALKGISRILLEMGFVAEDYPRALIEREREYPTGIEVPGFVNVALPHAHVKYTRRPVLFIGLLSEPIEFYKMDSPSEKVKVEAIILLALKDLDESASFLRKLTSLLSNKEFAVAIRERNAVNVRSLIEKLCGS